MFNTLGVWIQYPEEESETEMFICWEQSCIYAFPPPPPKKKTL